MRFIVPLLILSVLLFSVFRLYHSLRFSRKYSLGDRVRITERLSEQPYQSRSGQYFSLSGFDILTRDFPPYSLGDVLRVEGVLERDDSRTAFGLLGIKSDDFWLIYPNIEVLADTRQLEGESVSAWSSLLLRIYRLRSTIVDFYGKVLPEPHASLLAGIVLGERASMPPAFYTALRETGSLHIIAASGMNVTIIAGILINLLILVISRRQAVIISVVGVGFYALLAGLSPPVVRAALMGTIAYVAIAFGRQRDGLIALIVVAAAMLLVKPDYLVDVGWQLSVAATLGIVLLREPIKRYISIYIDIFHPSISEELAVTLSAQALTLPLILFYFEIFSWTSPLVNILLAPVVPVLMIWGALVAIVGMIWPFMGQVVAWGAWVFLEYFVRVVEAFSGWFGALGVAEVPVWFVVGYYLVIAWLISRKAKTTPMNRGG